MIKRYYILQISSLLGFLFCVSCANSPFRDYNAQITQPIKMVKQGHLTQALSLLQSKDIVFLLEHGTLERLGINFEQSILDYDAAYGYLNKWLASINNYRSGRVQNTLLAGITNDKVLNYELKDYEKVMLSTYQALNYFDLNDLNDARIEIKRMYEVEDRIKEFHDLQYQKVAQEAQNNSTDSLSSNINSLPNFDSLTTNNNNNQELYDDSYLNDSAVLNLKNSYQNAFSDYLAGFVFESLGENDLARPGYLRALELTNNNFITSTIDNIDQNKTNTPNSTNLLIILEIGHAPKYLSKTFTVPWVQFINKHTCPIALKLAMPILQRDENEHNVLSFNIANQTLMPNLMTDIDLMSARFLHDNINNIFLNNFLSVVRDYSLQAVSCAFDPTSTNGFSLLGGLSILYSQLMNNADERTWVTLPSKIYLSRTILPYKAYKLSLTLDNNNTYSTYINLTQPYQILTIRLIGNSLYFIPQKNMILENNFANNTGTLYSGSQLFEFNL